MGKLINLFKQSLGHELISGSFYVFLGTSIANFLAFLLNIYFARTLSYADYGILAALLSLFALLVVPATSIGSIINKFATRFITLKEENKVGALYRQFTKYLILGSAVAILASFLLSGFISQFLKINEPFLLLLLVITVCANYFLVLNINFLNSLLKFKYMSFSYAVSGIIKIIFGVALVYFGYRVYGALGSVLALIIVQFIITFIPLRKIISLGKTSVKLPTKEIWAFTLPATIAALSLFSFVSSDVILIKHFFNPSLAGLYGALSLVGKVIFYFTIPIPMVMFPLLVKKHSAKESYNKLFYLALILVAIPSILITAFYFIFPEFTIKLFLGGRGYLAIAPYLGFFGLFLTIYSLNNTFVSYFLSTGKPKTSLIVLFFAILQILGIILFHDNFNHIISVSIVTSALLLASLSIFFIKNLRYNPS